ncbi:MAG: hypothetical protein HFE47_05770 [Clostridia bacterium]|nr:hypothetical protein [Clostridia bacterium]
MTDKSNNKSGDPIAAFMFVCGVVLCRKKRREGVFGTLCAANEGKNKTVRFGYVCFDGTPVENEISDGTWERVWRSRRNR